MVSKMCTWMNSNHTWLHQTVKHSAIHSLKLRTTVQGPRLGLRAGRRPVQGLNGGNFFFENVLIVLGGWDMASSGLVQGCQEPLFFLPRCRPISAKEMLAYLHLDFLLNVLGREPFFRWGSPCVLLNEKEKKQINGFPQKYWTELVSPPPGLQVTAFCSCRGDALHILRISAYLFLGPPYICGLFCFFWVFFYFGRAAWIHAIAFFFHCTEMPCGGEKMSEHVSARLESASPPLRTRSLWPVVATNRRARDLESWLLVKNLIILIVLRHFYGLKVLRLFKILFSKGGLRTAWAARIGQVRNHKESRKNLFFLSFGGWTKFQQKDCWKSFLFFPPRSYRFIFAWQDNKIICQKIVFFFAR